MPGCGVAKISLLIIIMDSPNSTFLHLFRRYLRDQGLPITQQREQVAEVIFASPEHQSVEEIEAKLRDRGERIGKATVYRTLEMLVKSGLVAEHDFGEGFKRYEHLFGQAPVREHLVCTECGKVQAINSTELARVQREVAQQHGFMPARYRLAIYGICKDCQKAGRTLKWEGLVCPIETI
jgi:Fur family ferric uptake transcriptional regulator